MQLESVVKTKQKTKKSNSTIRFLPHLNFTWNAVTFNILGVHFSTHIETIPFIYYEGKLSEIQKLLNTWSKRHLGKFAVIKSKVTYLMMNVPDPTESFVRGLQKLFFDFLWDGKKDKIKRKTNFQAVGQGGQKW